MSIYDIHKENDSLNDSNVIISNLTDYPNNNYYPASPAVSAIFLNIINFEKYAAFFVIGFGMVGNMVSYYIFANSKLRKVSSSRFFSAIAVVDSGYLLSTFFHYLSRWQVGIYSIHGICPLSMYMNHVCAFLSIWYLTALVIEKFIGLYWPAKKAEFCTVFRAKCVIVGLAVFAVVCYHYITWTVGPGYQDQFVLCLPWPEPELLKTWQELGNVDSVVVSVIPYVVILFLSCLIAIKVWMFYRKRRSSGFRLHRRQTAFIPQDKEYKTSGLLLLISLITLVLCVPNGTCREFLITEPLELVTLAHFFQFASFAIKPVLYFVASKSYRKEFCKVFKYHCPCRRLFEDSSFSEMQTVSQQTDNGRAIEIVDEKSM